MMRFYIKINYDTVYYTYLEWKMKKNTPTIKFKD